MIRSTTRTGSAGLALALCLAMSLATACGSETDTGPTDTSASETDEASTVSTDLELLRAFTAVPGQPAVQWTETALGVNNDRAPGPTDYQRIAVLDYGDAATVRALVDGLEPVPTQADALAWFPAAVRDAGSDGALGIDSYTDVPGFDPGRSIGVVHDAPSYVIISYTTT